MFINVVLKLSCLNAILKLQEVITGVFSFSKINNLEYIMSQWPKKLKLKVIL